MGTKTIVNYDIENAERAIHALDAAGLTPNIALWAKLPDYENWRLVIASDKLDQDSPLAAYGQIDSALRAASIPRSSPAIHPHASHEETYDPGTPSRFRRNC